MNVSQWQKRLEDNFSSNGVIGEKLMNIIDQENAFGLKMLNYHGHRVLTDCFQSFFIETLEQGELWIRKYGVRDGNPTYPFIFLKYVTTFKRLRSAENLFLHGYPLDGFALLRDIKDQAIFLATIISGESSLSALSGVDPFATAPLTEARLKNIHNKKIAEEKRVMKLMTGSDSRLPEKVILELMQWERCFHAEVHGSHFTAAEALSWLRGQENLHFGPMPKEQSVAMYMNRATEINWMALRTFPYLQLEQQAFGKDWGRKWKILDASFEQGVKGLEELGKPVATALMEFVKVKFPFCPEKTFYAERG